MDTVTIDLVEQNEKLAERLATAEILVEMLANACFNAYLCESYEDVDEVVQFSRRFINGEVDSFD